MSFFRNLFNSNKTRQLSKIEYWQKWELIELIDDLKLAQKRLEKEPSTNHSSLIKFKEDFDEELYNVSHDNVADFTQLWKWFTAGGKWNELMGDKGEELRAQIYLRADTWKRNNDFVHGTKVGLDEELKKG